MMTYHLTVLGFLCLAAILCQVQGDLSDSIFGQPSPCVLQSTFFNNTAYNVLRESFTTRDTVDCCYRDATRNLCCLESFFDPSRGQNKYRCRCDPDVVCQARQTCLTPPSVCPAYARQSGPGQCDHPGIARLTVNIRGTTRDACQAVLTRTSIGGSLRDAFVTVERCGRLVERLLTFTRVGMAFGTTVYNLTPQGFQILHGSNGASYIVPSFPLTNPPPCPFHACPYNTGNAAMPRVESLTDCRFVSRRINQANGGAVETQEVPVTLAPTACTVQRSIRPATMPTLCFATVSSQAVHCQGDLGAPVYCTAPATNETIYIGNTAIQGCLQHIDLLVVPYTQQSGV